MNFRFPDEIIAHILNQSLIYTCACPAQVCKAINEQRRLFEYQKRCLNLTETDKAVHQKIASTVENIHAQLEQCLDDILCLEGWDMNTYQMPETMQKKLISEFDDSLRQP